MKCLKYLLTVLVGLAVLWSFNPTSFRAEAGPGLTTPADSTRYQVTNAGSFGLTVELAADGDTTIWIGFLAWSGTVVRMNGDVSVDPIEQGATVLVDDPRYGGARIYANPRDGEQLYSWGADTLTTSLPAQDYCCGGLLGYRIQALGQACYVKIYATGAKQ